MLVPSKATELGPERIDDAVPLVVCPVFQDVLNYEVAIGVPCQVQYPADDLCHQRGRLPAVVLQQALEDTAPEAVLCTLLCPALKLNKNKLHLTWRKKYDALL